jgi:two-component sensor histidine kinase
MPITSRFFIQSTVALFATAFVVLLVIVGMNIWLGERAQFYFDEVIAARNARSAAVEVRSAVQTSEAAQRGYLFTGNQVYLAPYDPAQTQARRQFDALRTALADYPELAPAIERLSTVLDDKFAEMDQTISLKRDRKDAEALAIARTNRGKLLMDEANVFFSGVILAADNRLNAAITEQRETAAWLRIVAMAGGALIILVVGAAIVTIYRYTRELRGTRDELTNLTAGLEGRVQRRTADLAKANDEMRVARDRAEVLLSEVNHRVANSLTMVSSLVGLQTNAVEDGVAKQALAETQARIHAVALVHKRLYSSGDARAVALDEYLAGVLDQFKTTLRGPEGVTIEHDLSPVVLKTDSTINLGVVVTEWITNAVKYAYPTGVGVVRVRLERVGPDKAQLSVEDDGVGRTDLAPAKGTGLGTRIVKAMAISMGGEIAYLHRNPGTLARLIFPVESA